MADLRQYKPSTFSNEVRTHENTLLSYMATNHGKTEAELVTGTGLSAQRVRNILLVMHEAGLVLHRYDLSNAERWWRTTDWHNALYDNRSVARTWQDANNGGKRSELATALAVYGDDRDEALADGFFVWFNAERSAFILVPI